MGKRIVGLGGGSWFFATAIREIAQTPELAGSELVLFDLSAEAVNRMVAYGRRVNEKLDTDFSLRGTTDRDDALDYADFVVSSIGAHGPNQEARRLNMEMGEKYGIVQTIGDTVGPGGLSVALRLIPAYVELGQLIVRRSPHCVFLNHSNPMAAICRALIKHAGLKNVIGLCHGVQSTERYLAKVLGVPLEELKVQCAGLNHMLWVLQLRHKGRDMIPVLHQKMDEHKEDPDRQFAWKLFEVFGHFPVNKDGHLIEFFPYLRQCSRPEDLPYGLNSCQHMLMTRSREKNARRTEDMRQVISGEKEVEIPESVSPENIGALIGAMITGQREVRILNLQNEGCIPNMPEFAHVEIQGATHQGGVLGLHMGPLPDNVVGPQVARAFQIELTVDAAVKGDRRLALQALAQDPLILSLKEAENLLADIISAQQKGLL